MSTLGSDPQHTDDIDRTVRDVAGQFREKYGEDVHIVLFVLDANGGASGSTLDDYTTDSRVRGILRRIMRRHAGGERA
jgi:hypothetical protein